MLKFSNLKNLRRIESNAFAGCSMITELDMGGCDSFEATGGVNGSGSFMNCSALKKVTLPAVPNILLGNSAFQNCGALEEVVNLKPTIKGFGINTFRACVNLVIVNPTFTQLEEIGASAFDECSKITGNLTIAGPLTILGANAFYRTGLNGKVDLTGCYALVTIGSQPFGTGITEVDAHSLTTLEEVGQSFVNNSQQLTLVDFRGCTSLKRWSGTGGHFWQCLTLKDAYVDPASTGCTAVESIPANFMRDCRALETPLDFTGCTQLSKIDDRAFMNCYVLPSIKIDSADCGNKAALTKIGESAFQNCYLIENDFDFSNCLNLTTLGINIFYTCKAIKSVNFSGCTGITNIPNSICRDCTALTSADFTGCTGVTEIAGSAFMNCGNVTTWKLFPDDLGTHALTSIGGSAFQNASLPLSVDFSECPNLTNIGAGAFTSNPTEIFDFTGCPINSAQYYIIRDCRDCKKILMPDSKFLSTNSTAGMFHFSQGGNCKLELIEVGLGDGFSVNGTPMFTVGQPSYYQVPITLKIHCESVPTINKTFMTLPLTDSCIIHLPAALEADFKAAGLAAQGAVPAGGSIAALCTSEGTFRGTIGGVTYTCAQPGVSGVAGYRMQTGQTVPPTYDASIIFDL